MHSSQQFFTAYNALMKSPDKPLVNRAVAGDLYHPGSVFKLVVASAALDSGKATPDTASPIRPACSCRSPAISSRTHRAGPVGRAPRQPSPRQSS
ncbi:MAG: penicillin-binding transpeptidase domain-containing protein [Galbitalea sp.]